jgi:RimJ/RimL family protein N-acetyltransferase
MSTRTGVQRSDVLGPCWWHRNRLPHREPDLLGKGVGRRKIAQFANACWDRYPSAARITVALQQDNIASWKALEAAGFRQIWTGDLISSDPSDRGPSFIYVAYRNQD